MRFYLLQGQGGENRTEGEFREKIVSDTAAPNGLVAVLDKDIPQNKGPEVCIYASEYVNVVNRLGPSSI